MRVFVSWSGRRSHEIALALRDWFPAILPGVEPWVSTEDIDKGARWNPELGRQLDAARFGVICLVPENLKKEWVIFEAGAIARSFETARVAPLLVGVELKDVPEPLAQFQCTVFEKEDVRRLVRSLNRAMEPPADPGRVDEVFERAWPDLEGRVHRTEGPPRPVDRTPEPPAVEQVVVEAPSRLPEQQIAILRSLAQTDMKPPVEIVARLIRESQTRAQYHLDRLVAAGLMNYQFVRGVRAYVLTEAGRAYIVENNIDR